MSEQETFEIETQRCSGGCCRAFSVSFVTENGGLAAFRASVDADPEAHEEYKNIADMLIERGHSGFDQQTGEPIETDEEVFGCRHFNEETRDCMNYDGRPWMCSAFPYGRPCPIGSCTRETRACR